MKEEMSDSQLAFSCLLGPSEKQTLLGKKGKPTNKQRKEKKQKTQFQMVSLRPISEITAFRAAGSFGK